MDSPKKQASKILRDKKMYQRWLAIFMCLALVVTSGTLTALKLTGQAWTGTEQVYACTYTPHQHTEQCYDAEGKLVCGYSDLVLHTHDARCYDSEGSLICTMEELEEHSHTSECYTEVKTLICTEEEHEAIPAHKHSDECYTTETVEQKDLTCGLEEGANAVEAQPAVEGHHHTDACYTITPAVEATYDEEGNELTAAVPEQRTLTCGLEESEGQPAVEAVPGHVHTEECYTTQQVEKQVLTCGLEEHDEEIPAHHHSDECYTTEMVLNCDKPELIAHEHTDDCYEIELDEDGNEISRTLTCKLPQLVAHQHGDECFTEVALEAEGTYCGKEAHKHTGSCYMDVNGELVLTCDKEEHVHTDECFVEPVLYCGKQEHTHTEECYDADGNLICELEEHTHTEECYIAPEVEPVEQEFRGEDYTVTVSYDPAAFDAEVSLNVREIAEGTEEYATYYQQSLEATGSESLSFARFFDVTFTDAEGNEKEPLEGYEVDVQIAYDQPVEIAENENGQAVHFAKGEETPEILDAAVEDNTFSFKQPSFSVVGTTVSGYSSPSNGEYFIYVRGNDGYYALKNDGTATQVSVSNNEVEFPEGTNASEYTWKYESSRNGSTYISNGDRYLSPNANGLFVDGTKTPVTFSNSRVYNQEVTGEKTEKRTYKYPTLEGWKTGDYERDITISNYHYLTFNGGTSFVQETDSNVETWPYVHKNIALVDRGQSWSYSNAVSISFAKPVLLAASVTVGDKTTVAENESITLNATVKDGNGITIRNPKGTFTWTVDDPSIATLEADGKSCTVNGLKAGEVTITVSYANPISGETITADSYKVTVTSSPYIDDGLGYSVGEGLDTEGLYQVGWNGDKLLWWDTNIDPKNRPSPQKQGNHNDDHVESVQLIPCDYQGNPIAVNPGTNLSVPQGNAHIHNATHDDGKALSVFFPNAKQGTESSGQGGNNSNWVEVSKEQATYIEVTDSFWDGQTQIEKGRYGKDSKYWDILYRRESGVKYYRREVRNDIFGYAKLEITPEDGYYVTKIYVACLNQDQRKDWDHPVICSRMQKDTAVTATFDVSQGVKTGFVLRSDAFSHSTTKDVKVHGYYILIETARIPSPMYVKYDPGTVTTKDGDVDAKTFFEFAPADNVWLDNSDARYTNTSHNLDNSATVDKIVKTGNNGSSWATGDRVYYPAGVQKSFEDAAAAKGYRFVGWKVVYYDDKVNGNLSGDAMESIELTQKSSSTDTQIREPRKPIQLATNAKLIAQWEPVPVAEIIKQVKNLTSEELDEIRNYQFTVTVNNLQDESKPLTEFSVRTITRDAAGEHIGYTPVKMNNGQGVFTLPLKGNETFRCTIIGLPSGTYTVEETNQGGAEVVQYVNGQEMEVEVAADPQNQKTATVTVINDFHPQGQNVKILKVDAEGHALKGATFTLTGPEGFEPQKITTDVSGLVLDTQTLGLGDYVLTETDAPEGYTEAGVIKFTVETTGVKVTEGADQLIAEAATQEGKAVVDKDNYLLEVTDSVYVLRVKNTVTNAAVKIIKVAAGNTTPLPGAHFALYKAVYANEITDTTVSIGNDKWGELIEPDLVTNNNGEVMIPGGLVLNQGYYLVETQAPAGFIGTNEPVELRYGPVTGTQSFDLEVKGISNSTTFAEKVEPENPGDPWGVQITNNPGVELPHTGGIGTHGFMVGGGLLMMLAAGLLLLNKRRRAAEQ